VGTKSVHSSNGRPLIALPTANAGQYTTLICKCHYAGFQVVVYNWPDGPLTFKPEIPYQLYTLVLSILKATQQSLAHTNRNSPLPISRSISKSTCLIHFCKPPFLSYVNHLRCSTRTGGSSSSSIRCVASTCSTRSYSN